MVKKEKARQRVWALPLGKRNPNEREKHLHYTPKPNLLQPPKPVSSTCTIPQPLSLFISFFFFFLNLLFLTPQTHNKNLPKFFIFSLSLSSSLSTNKNHGSGGAQPTSHRSERARRSGHREVGHGPEAHGRPIHALPHLQRNRSSHLPLFALVRRRHRMLHMFRVGSHGLQQLRRLRHRPTLAGQNRDSPSQPPLLITAFSVSIAF